MAASVSSGAELRETNKRLNLSMPRYGNKATTSGNKLPILEMFLNMAVVSNIR
jgi:hypothetical protein